MTVKDQFAKLKENWLLILIVAILFVVVAGGNLLGDISSVSKRALGGYGGYAADMMAAESYGGARGYYPPTPSDGDFAPDVQERLIVKTASMTTEVERGDFAAAQQRVRGIASGAGAIILSENANRYGEGWKGRYQGSYQLKVPVDKYDSVVAQLKGIGDVTAFNEDAQDVTGQHLSLQDRLETENGRLARYQLLLREATTVDEKLQLTDRLYQEERTIKYLQDQLANLDRRVDYTTVSLSINEKQSGYVGVALVKFSDLVKSLVSSFNGLLYLLFVALPWAVALVIIRIVWWLFRRKKR